MSNDVVESETDLRGLETPEIHKGACQNFPRNSNISVIKTTA